MSRAKISSPFPARACAALALPRPLSARRRASTTSHHAVAHPSSSSSPSPTSEMSESPSFVIRSPNSDAEFSSIAALRAEAYYADQPGGGGRFVESYKKQFREQEARSLAQRVAPRRRRKNNNSSSGSRGSSGGGGGGVFGGVLGALVGRRAAEVAASLNSSEAGTKTTALVVDDDDEELLPPECVCLVAVEEEEDEIAVVETEEEEDDDEQETPPTPSTSPSSVVLGALDVRPPASAGGGHPSGVPIAAEDAATASAVLNVAVAPSARRRGVARALLSRAAELASREWKATALYTTVAATNAGARALYADFGFVEVVVSASSASGGGGGGGSGGGGGGSGGGGRGETTSPVYSTLVGKELLLKAEI